MLVRKAYRYKLKTTPEIKQRCLMMAGCCRLVWNKALALNLYRLENKQPWVSNTISKNHAIVVLEDLKVSNMSKSAKGTADTPGKNVKAKSGLNKSILDQGWSMFADMLEYKQKWRGGELFFVAPHHTSQTCPGPACQHRSPENRPTQSKFECVSCGYTDNADLVGATNVLERGHRLLACAELALADSTKQEPKAA